MQPTHLDLFSGIGGFALAAQWAGWRTTGFCETDPYASAILRKHWPDIPNLGDIRNIRGIKADLVTGGFPCQPFSVAGKQRGASDDRALWPEMRRVIAEATPTWILAENVPGIINMELDRVLSDLETLGYTCWPLVIPACAVDARHQRDRVWLVAHSMRGGQPGPRQPLHALYPATPSNGQTTQPLNGRGSSLWIPEPKLGRVAHGIPNREDRLKCLGNAIVPQVAYQILKVMIGSK